ncbi:hypothetical protein BDQ17DRAFT_1544843 [Cyathus striatus]|nr:hypothetical protein BDQ17DRAFT_1544843 [Cyathus striatus]
MSHPKSWPILGVSQHVRERCHDLFFDEVIQRFQIAQQRQVLARFDEGYYKIQNTMHISPESLQAAGDYDHKVSAVALTISMILLDNLPEGTTESRQERGKPLIDYYLENSISKRHANETTAGPNCEYVIPIAGQIQPKRSPSFARVQNEGECGDSHQCGNSPRSVVIPLEPLNQFQYVPPSATLSYQSTHRTERQGSCRTVLTPNTHPEEYVPGRFPSQAPHTSRHHPYRKASRNDVQQLVSKSTAAI